MEYLVYTFIFTLLSYIFSSIFYYYFPKKPYDDNKLIDKFLFRYFIVLIIVIFYIKLNYEFNQTKHYQIKIHQCYSNKNENNNEEQCKYYYDYLQYNEFYRLIFNLTNSIKIESCLILPCRIFLKRLIYDFEFKIFFILTLLFILLLISYCYFYIKRKIDLYRFQKSKEYYSKHKEQNEFEIKYQ